MKLACTIIVLAGLGMLSLQAEIEITDTRGNTAKVHVFEVTDQEANLLVNQQRRTLALDELTKESRERLIKFAREHGKFKLFPKLRIEVNVATQRRRVGSSSYMKTQTMKPSAVITGASSMEPIPEATATMVLITQETEAKYVARAEDLEVLANETIDIPEALDGQRRKFDFQENTQYYDSDRDHTNIGGKVYKYYIFGLRDKKTGSLVDFQTNDPELKKYIENNPGDKEKFLKMKVGQKFSVAQ